MDIFRDLLVDRVEKNSSLFQKNCTPSHDMSKTLPWLAGVHQSPMMFCKALVLYAQTLLVEGSWKFTLPKTNMAMEHGPFEDVFPIENEDCLIAILVFWGVRVENLPSA